MVPFFFIKNHNSLENIELINKRGIDLLINCGTPRILKATVLKAPKIGVLNCHPGILPDYFIGVVPALNGFDIMATQLVTLHI